MKTIDFPLVRPVRITPVHGQSHVAVTTTGDVAITETVRDAASLPRPRSVTLVDTGRARLKRTPADLFRILEIRLPTSVASEEEFYNEMDRLLEMYSLMYGLA